MIAKPDKVLVHRLTPETVQVTINRPEKRNAVDIDALTTIADALTNAVDSDARLVILRGVDGWFCAGADISAMHERGFAPALQEVLGLLSTAPAVMIAAIDGPALGAGLQLAMFCDLRVATDRSAFGVPAGKLGLAIDHATVVRLAQMIGRSTATELLLGAEPIDGQRAYELGFVQRRGDYDVAESWATRIAALAPLSIRAHKLALGVTPQPPSSGDAEAMAAAIGRAGASDDFTEGRLAFAEKRPPVFRGQ